MRNSAAALGLIDDLAAETIARLPGVVTVEQCNLDADHVVNGLETALKSALENLTGMRLAEGAALEKDFRERIEQLGAVVEIVSGLAEGVVAAYREKLLQRLKEAGMNELAEDERIIKEIALFADRCDISEELVRLRSHLKQFDELLCSDEPVGRTLDFLCQELFREINTVGSKANEVEITRHVVAFKTELERIREQVQNVE
jgi:uncharacterized protein (TIGR00255 family)